MLPWLHPTCACKRPFPWVTYCGEIIHRIMQKHHSVAFIWYVACVQTLTWGMVSVVKRAYLPKESCYHNGSTTVK